jgi:hypothetical protein
MGERDKVVTADMLRVLSNAALILAARYCADDSHDLTAHAYARGLGKVTSGMR